MWGSQAHDLGWTTLDLFGVHSKTPAARFSCMGLLPLVNGGRVVAITVESAVIERQSGSRLTYTRRPPDAECVAVWELPRAQNEWSRGTDDVARKYGRKQANHGGGQFRKGVSGNPRGKPPGARHATTDHHPSSSPVGHCAWCGQPEAGGAAVVPFGVGERHTWLHPHCWPAWHRRRRADALAALRSFGIPVPVAAHTERDTAAGRRYQAGLRITAGQCAEPTSPEAL
jgi:hypothetical protein